MQFRPSAFALARPQSVCHTQTDGPTDVLRDRHFVKIEKSYSEHPKTCLSNKKWK